MKYPGFRLKIQSLDYRKFALKYFTSLSNTVHWYTGAPQSVSLWWEKKASICQKIWVLIFTDDFRTSLSWVAVKKL